MVVAVLTVLSTAVVWLTALTEADLAGRQAANVIFLAAMAGVAGLLLWWLTRP